MKIRSKNQVVIKAKAESISHARTDVYIRDLVQTIDEPLERGGTNQGISPTENICAALAACTNVIFNRCAEQSGLTIKQFAIDVEADFDRRGVLLQEEIDLPFPEFRLSFKLDAKGSQAGFDEARANLRKFCPVSKLLEQSGSKIIESWDVTLDEGA